MWHEELRWGQLFFPLVVTGLGLIAAWWLWNTALSRLVIPLFRKPPPRRPRVGQGLLIHPDMSPPVPARRRRRRGRTLEENLERLALGYTPSPLADEPRRDNLQPQKLAFLPLFSPVNGSPLTMTERKKAQQLVDPRVAGLSSSDTFLSIPPPGSILRRLEGGVSPTDQDSVSTSMGLAQGPRTPYYNPRGVLGSCALAMVSPTAPHPLSSPPLDELTSLHRPSSPCRVVDDSRCRRPVDDFSVLKRPRVPITSPASGGEDQADVFKRPVPPNRSQRMTLLPGRGRSSGGAERSDPVSVLGDARHTNPTEPEKRSAPAVNSATREEKRGRTEAHTGGDAKRSGKRRAASVSPKARRLHGSSPLASHSQVTETTPLPLGLSKRRKRHSGSSQKRSRGQDKREDGAEARKPGGRRKGRHRRGYSAGVTENTAKHGTAKKRRRDDWASPPLEHRSKESKCSSHIVTRVMDSIPAGLAASSVFYSIPLDDPTGVARTPPIMTRDSTLGNIHATVTMKAPPPSPPLPPAPLLAGEATDLGHMARMALQFGIQKAVPSRRRESKRTPSPALTRKSVPGRVKLSNSADRRDGRKRRGVAHWIQEATGDVSVEIGEELTGSKKEHTAERQAEDKMNRLLKKAAEEKTILEKKIVRINSSPDIRTFEKGSLSLSRSISLTGPLSSHGNTSSPEGGTGGGGFVAQALAEMTAMSEKKGEKKGEVAALCRDASQTTTAPTNNPLGGSLAGMFKHTEPDPSTLKQKQKKRSGLSSTPSRVKLSDGMRSNFGGAAPSHPAVASFSFPEGSSSTNTFTAQAGGTGHSGTAFSISTSKPNRHRSSPTLESRRRRSH